VLSFGILLILFSVHSLEEKRRENQEILNHTLDGANDLFATLAVIVSILAMLSKWV
jgi:hypothetical protein